MHGNNNNDRPALKRILVPNRMLSWKSQESPKMEAYWYHRKRARSVSSGKAAGFRRWIWSCKLALLRRYIPSLDTPSGSVHNASNLRLSTGYLGCLWGLKEYAPPSAWAPRLCHTDTDYQSRLSRSRELSSFLYFIGLDLRIRIERHRLTFDIPKMKFCRYFRDVIDMLGCCFILVWLPQSFKLFKGDNAGGYVR